MFLKVVAILVAWVLASAFAASGFAAGGAVFVAFGALFTALSAGRLWLPLPTRARLPSALRPWWLWLLGATVVGVLVGHVSLRARLEAEAEAQRARMEQQERARLRREAAARELLAALPSLTSRLATADRALSALKTGEAKTAVAALEGEVEVLRQSSLAQDVDVQAFLASLQRSHAAVDAAEEVAALAQAKSTGASRAPPAARLLEVTRVLDALGALRAPSPTATSATAELQQARRALVDSLGVFAQPAAVAAELLKGRSAPAGNDGTIKLTGFAGAEAFAVLQKNACVAMYLARTQGTNNGLADPAVSDFLQLALGPTSKGVKLEPPPGRGVRYSTRVISGTRVRAGWMDANLVELSVGDVAP